MPRFRLAQRLFRRVYGRNIRDTGEYYRRYVLREIRGLVATCGLTTSSIASLLMKKLLFASLLLLSAPIVVVAQKSLSNNPQSSPRFRSNGAENSGVGFKAGVNFNAIQGDGIKKMYGDSYDRLTQYHFGAYAQIGVTNWFSVQPEVIYQRKGFTATEKIITSQGIPNHLGTGDSTISSTEGKKTVKLSYLSVPVLLVFNVLQNVAIHIGPQFSYLLNVRNGDKSVVTSTYKYNSVDIGLIGGVEAKFEFLRIGARYDYSLLDLRKGGTYTVPSAPTVTRQAEADIRNGVFQLYLGAGL